MDKNPFCFVSPIGQIVWEDRYALRNENGELVEHSIEETFHRVANAISVKEKDRSRWAELFYKEMVNKYFCPAGRVLAHAGTHFSQLFNCYVIPFEDDSLESIMNTAKAMAVTQKYGGGTGFNYSRLRPSGSYIKGVNGRSCGVLGFIDMMSVISGVIEQGGSRRGANMGILEVSHPDVWEFISYKKDHNWDRLLEFVEVKDESKWESFKYDNPYKLQMYNVSIGINDEFLSAVNKDEEWPLLWKGVVWPLYSVVYKKNSGISKEPLTFEVIACDENSAIWKVKKKVPYPGSSDTFEVTGFRNLKAREIWDRICYSAWADGCPGLINFSTARRMHNIEYVRPIEASNPCGEQLLSSYSVCDLGSLVLPSFVKNDVNGNSDIDWEKMRETINIAVRFLDDVTDNCTFPLPQFGEAALSERRIGLGTMGLHDMLIALKLDYDSDSGRKKVEEILEFIRDESYRASIEIAREKGSFSFFNSGKYCNSAFIRSLPEDIQEDIRRYGIRNATILSQAPTGTIGAMYGCSTGCEPWFSMSFQRRSRLGLFEDGCPAYLEWKKSAKGAVPSYFKSAQEISTNGHLAMLVLYSKYIDSSTSKTLNLPGSSTVQDVSEIFMAAMSSGVKGVTIFRDGCKDGVLSKGGGDNKGTDGRERGIVQNSVQDDKFQKSDKSHWKKRGDRVAGATTRIHMQDHNIYVTVNKNVGGDMVEVFAIVGESKDSAIKQTSGIEDSWAEGLGKIISLALRAGVSPEAIIRNLKNIPSDKPIFTTIGLCDSSELVPSPPHAIARVMEEEWIFCNGEIQKKDRIKKVCSRCGSSNLTQRSSTCYECLDCQFSGCG